MSPDDVVVDFGRLIERLILFETFVLQSRNLLEIPHLIRRFGFEPVLRLIESGAIEITPDKTAVGVTDETAKKGKPGPFSLRVMPIGLFQPLAFEADIVELKIKMNNLSADGWRRLERVLRANVRLGQFGPDRGLIDDLFREIESPDRLTPFIKVALKRLNAARVGQPFSFHIDVGEEGGDKGGRPITVETDLSKSYGLPVQTVGSVVRTAVFAMGSELIRLNQMRTHTALTGLREAEVSVFRGRLDFLAAQLSPEVQTTAFHRVVEAAGVPDLRDPAIAETASLDEVLAARESDELRAFRDWLWSVNEVDAAELNERVRSLRARSGVFARSTSGRVLRWVVTTGLGTVPVVGPVLGAAASWADTFVTEQVLNRAGPATFIGERYTSLFSEAKRQSGRKNFRR